MSTRERDLASFLSELHRRLETTAELERTLSEEAVRLRHIESRLQQIYDGVDRLLAEHAPFTVVIEDLYAEYSFPRTALLMKVHTSNYAIAGFTASVPLAELVQLGRTHGAPVAADLGSGSPYNRIRKITIP